MKGIRLKALNNLNTEISTFEELKKLSEKKWETEELTACWGFQIQKNSKWNDGLSEDQLNDFETQVGFKFSQPLRNFYRVMNGLNKPGINISGDLNTQSPTFRSVFYSYPKDLGLIKEQINWILESNELSEQDLMKGEAPYIFPFFGHRFLILDKNEQVLSMYGADIIPWADNLSKAIYKDVFDLSHNQIKQNSFKPVKFWLDKMDC
jgi:hypothetical protein